MKVRQAVFFLDTQHFNTMGGKTNNKWALIFILLLTSQLPNLTDICSGISYAVV